MTDDCIRSNKSFKRLYPLLKEGIIELLSAKLRWSNEPVEIIPKSVDGNLLVGALGASFVYGMPSTRASEENIPASCTLTSARSRRFLKRATGWACGRCNKP